MRYPGSRRDPDTLVCTGLAADPLVILGWFFQHWAMEITYEEGWAEGPTPRAHLSLETQRQHCDKAVCRTTPALLGLYWLVTLYVQTFATSI